MYSVEYVDVDDQYNCWNQAALVDHKWVARLAQFDFKVKLLGQKQKTRIREV